MKVQIIAADTRERLEVQLQELVAGDVTVHAIAYAMGPRAHREALVLYSDGATPEIPAAVRAWLKDVVAS